VRHPTRRHTGGEETVPHPHFIQLDAGERFAIVADLGLDELRAYPFDSGPSTLGAPAVLRLAPGAGPRHLAFHPDGGHAYVIDELDSTITALTYSSGAGTFSVIHTLSTLPGHPEASNSTAEVLVRPDGRFLYGSNRGHDSIAIFSIDAATGRLAAVGQESTRGRTPRNFAIDPSGTYLVAANQNSDTIVVFRIDAASGRLAAVGQPLRIPRPVCLLMAGRTD
jgi:6-phosphogluconolactonase